MLITKKKQGRNGPAVKAKEEIGKLYPLPASEVTADLKKAIAVSKKNIVS